jgi:hypothetical protein
MLLNNFFLILFIDPIDNSRYGKLEFTAKFDSTIHGLAGYFDCHLYKDVDISNILLTLVSYFSRILFLNFNFPKALHRQLTHQACLAGFRCFSHSK